MPPYMGCCNFVFLCDRNTYGLIQYFCICKLNLRLQSVVIIPDIFPVLAGFVDGDSIFIPCSSSCSCRSVSVCIVGVPPLAVGHHAGCIAVCSVFVVDIVMILSVFCKAQSVQVIVIRVSFISLIIQNPDSYHLLNTEVSVQEVPVCFAAGRAFRCSATAPFLRSFHSLRNAFGAAPIANLFSNYSS